VDGDVASVINCAEPNTGIDIYLGSGGAPEGVLAAAVLCCIRGQMQARLAIDTEEDVIETETVVMRSVTGTVRRIVAEYRQFEKFHL
jgi:fructose-1,6-bisphosphatase II / sedoheptulose-1,7-bisphosphatase